MLVKFDTRRLDPNDFNDLTHASNEKTRDGRKVAWSSTKALPFNSPNQDAYSYISTYYTSTKLFRWDFPPLPRIAF